MRLIFLLVLVIGIGTAGYAAFLIQGQFAAKDSEINRLSNELRKTREQVVETTPVVVTTQRVSYAHKLTADDITLINWPTAHLPEGIFSTIEDVVGGEDAETRYVKRTLEPGEPVLAIKVTDFGEDIGINTLLDPGTRAFAIRVDVATGVSGFISPGDEVDIYWTGRNLDQTITQLILEKVKIIAIDQQATSESLRPTVARTVTLQVSPDIVANLVQFQSSGSLTLSLRGVEDTTTAGAISVNTNALIGNEIIPVEEVEKCYQTVRRGVEVIRNEVPCE
ncbi:MAG: Flp pilus assembly protein CpaB [Rhodobacteraceae bacterium]|nr:Flp pilus assembly protein CpaB [Paracoccaceae bacterium]